MCLYGGGGGTKSFLTGMMLFWFNVHREEGVFISSQCWCKKERGGACCGYKRMIVKPFETGKWKMWQATLILRRAWRTWEAKPIIAPLKLLLARKNTLKHQSNVNGDRVTHMHLAQRGLRSRPTGPSLQNLLWLYRDSKMAPGGLKIL